MNEINIYWIDLFCGAGGTTTGIHLSEYNHKVIACVNHDAEAIRCHKENHPECIHFTEDIRNFNVVLKIKSIVKKLKQEDPSCFINIWASLECTHFSKAKGGLSRDADSRTLADHLYKYVEQLDPDYVYIENVKEFLTWCPLDNKGKPIKNLYGTDYNRWKDNIKFYGYDYNYKLLNSADFGAYTSRERYFGVFAKIGLPITFPKPTHSKKPDKDLKPWKAVKDVLNLEDQGRSIFGLTKMNKPYSENTLKRVYLGLLKFKDEINQSFLTSYYGNGNAHSIDKPCGTLTTKDRYALHFINYDYSSPTHTSVNTVAGSITTIPKHKLTSVQWTFDTQFSNTGRSIESPAQTLIARMDKKPIYLVSTNTSSLNHKEIKTTDSDIVVKIKTFMIQHGISDIKMRMLHVSELKTIQGFPSGFKLTGTKTNQLKFIGNSVVPDMAKALVNANYQSLIKLNSQAV